MMHQSKRSRHTKRRREGVPVGGSYPSRYPDSVERWADEAAIRSLWLNAALLVASLLLVATAIGAEPSSNAATMGPIQMKNEIRSIMETATTTVKSFNAQREGTSVHFSWLTASEVGNLGFNLYVLEGGKLRRLNDELIRSNVVDSLEPQLYGFQAEDVRGDLFLIEDEDIFGDHRYLGPFPLGESTNSR